MSIIVQHVFEKKHFIIIPPHLKFVLSNEMLDYCDKKKIKRMNNADTFSQPSLIIFTKGADIFGHDCVCVCVYA